MSIWSNGTTNGGDWNHPTFYRVIIDMTGYNSVAGNTASGGITPNSEQALVAAGGAAGTSQNVSETRARGNLRWGKIVQALNEYTQASIFNIDITETNTVDQATSIGFSVSFEQDEYNRVEDLDTPGTFLTGADWVTQQVGVAISNTYGELRDIPTFAQEGRNQVSLSAVGPVARAAAEGDTTVETSATGGSGIEETAQ